MSAGAGAGATVRLLGPDDAAVLDRVAPDVFDRPIDPHRAAEFLGDPRHHLAVAVSDAGGDVVGMASAVTHLRPDKPPELYVDEIGVAPAWRRRGLGRRLLATLFERGRALGCADAWLATERDNAAARALFVAAGGKEMSAVCVMYRLDGGREREVDPGKPT